MGRITPPAPISRAEFERRQRAGARTFAELAPELAEWQRRRARRCIATLVIQVVAILCFGSVAILWALVRGMSHGITDG